MEEEWPEWALPGEADEYGNAKCRECGGVQSPSFRSCIYCCPHDNLAFTEKWYGPDDGVGWGLAVECATCGKNFGFDLDTMIGQYMAVRKDSGDS